MTLPITLEALQVLDAINREGSFAAAAAALHRVPSAISYSVQKLEQDLGVTLFSRQGRKSVLTPAGQVLLQQGREILQATERLAETARQVERGWESSLAIAVDTVLDMAVMFPLLNRFYPLRPEVAISLQHEALAGGWEALVDKRVDLAVGITAKPAGVSGIEMLPIGTVKWLLCVHPQHPLAEAEKPVSAARLESERMVVVADSSRHLPSLSFRMLSKQPALRVATLQQKIDAQIAGLGVGFVPEHLVQAQLQQGLLRVVAVQGVQQESVMYMAWRKGEKGKALHWFIDQLQQIYSIG